MKHEGYQFSNFEVTPGDNPKTPTYSDDWAYYDDHTARSRSELRHFSTEEGMKQGLICREPMKQ